MLVIDEDECVHRAIGLEGGDAGRSLERFAGLQCDHVLVLLDDLRCYDTAVGQVGIGDVRREDDVRRVRRGDPQRVVLCPAGGDYGHHKD